MKTKEEIVANWLPRYTKRNLEDFGEYILLTNFNKYVEIFAENISVSLNRRRGIWVDGVIHNEKCTNWGNYPMIAGFCWIK